MNTEHMRYYIATVEEGSYAAASRMLYISPEGISKAIRTLEKDYGLTLIEKDGRNIRPTRAGLEFYRRAKELAEGLIDMRCWASEFTGDNLADLEGIDPTEIDPRMTAN